MVRLLSGLALALAAAAAIVLLPADILRFVALAVALVAAREFLAIASVSGRGPTPLVAYALTAAVCWVMSFPAPDATLLVTAALAVLVVEVLFRSRTLGEAATTVAAGVYVGLPLGALVAIHALGGREAVLLLVGTIAVSDSAQYYSGRLLGRHALAPTISPKKTVEGAIGGVIVGTAVMVAGARFVFPFARTMPLVLIGIAVVLLGICGDLFESRLKRAVGLKDSSSLIPGHGGVLDRIDALLLATPAFYLFLLRLM
jgi:phosphatidate cytidylyltransferase